jgi:hypothetical protein
VRRRNRLVRNALRLLTSAHMKSEVKTDFPDSESQTLFCF